MSESVLETERYAHEELERLQQAIVDRQVANPKAPRERLRLEHQSAQFLNQFRETSKKLLVSHESSDRLKDQEVARINADDDLTEFYKSLGEIQEFHKKYPDHKVEDLSQLYSIKPSQPGIDEIDTLFRGEEMYGRFMDLNECYEEYINLSNVQHISYLEYLKNLEDFDQIPKPEKNQTYINYITHLYEYLVSFYRRTHPLSNLDKIIAVFDTEFDAAWEAGLPGWYSHNAEAEKDGKDSTEAFYCEVCQKFFGKITVFEAHKKSKAHNKAVKRMQSSSPSTTSNTNEKQKGPKAIARIEFLIKKLTSLLDDVRKDTRENVVRRQTLTAAERLAEVEAAEREAFEQSTPSVSVEGNQDEESDQDDEEKIYNPLKLPLGWDGKPIPFWLWKLHGLGKEFPCEICGNYVYMGRKAFDKHFTEQRHIYGLKCLGISPSPLFNQITSIDEALQLWQKYKVDSKKRETTMASLNEMEDDEGNVMSEKVYNDLKAQGLL
ncbi:U2 snRNP-associated protein sap61 [Schizosaccharomyces pombe]|uniref:Pre-mRNA-splicing factor sap61 n=1 Tax=Schizosaccharomyces pombe (strain 972 / ATCC 24843) TaxID=284812 RepID=SAP61_SCHPO|nr:U2 snRNP-associated protein sap61 [Schizosaccharomyces pombe]O59706.1 RecName: Full=Pre-mRNA-splicing factor sap61; AltName: Full=Spliceosome-associated protein 61 [Schizosaccharomyces pombe 972h-]CAA19057.1 U2 snRNP-associated protein sap61 [Schizosaccharomyces pombe]|eukprot:NP_595337.1 U2 snRNP-associated protein sap61 [Schizosaccharomyces pombe]